MQNSIRDKFNFLFVFYVFVLIGVPVSFIIKCFNIELTTFQKSILEFALELLIFVVVILIYRKDLKENFKSLTKKKFIEILITMVGLFFGAYVIQLFSGIIVIILIKLMGLTLSDSANNEAVKELLKSAPVLMGIDAVILAPFIEESLFRMGLFKSIKNKKVAIAASGIIFGIMHVIGNKLIILTLPIVLMICDYIITSKNKHKIILSITCLVSYLILIICYMSFKNGGFILFLKAIDIKEAIYIIQYVSVGMYLAFIYYKFKNVFYSMIPHAMVNLNATILLSFM